LNLSAVAALWVFEVEHVSELSCGNDQSGIVSVVGQLELVHVTAREPLDETASKDFLDSNGGILLSILVMDFEWHLFSA
jgi:hypothetical protein